MSADVVGYSRLMQDDEAATVETLQKYRAAIDRIVTQHGGRIVNAPGDNILAEFPSAVEAVKAAVEIQKNIEGRNAELPEGRRMQLRLGVNVGDVIEEQDGTIYGDGVNIAARMEALAEAGGICIASQVHDAIAGKVGFGFDFLGEQQVKNITQPVSVYRVRSEPHPQKDRPSRPTRSHLRAATIGAGLCAIVLIAAIWLFLEQSSKTEPVASIDSAADDIALPPNDKPSIAVLPFKNLSGDTEQDYFAEGMAEDIITDLSKISGLFVISANSSFGFAERVGDVGDGLRGMVNLSAVATELHVRYVLQGSVRRSGDAVRINVQLVETENGEHLWAERYDRKLSDTFAVQDEITEKVVAELSVRLGEDERVQIARPYTDNMEAYDLYLRGRKFHGGVDRETMLEALSLIERAIEIDPDFAAAHAELSWIHAQAYGYQWTDDHEESLRQAIDAAEMAVQFDPKLASARARLGWAYLWARRFDEAVAEARQAVEIDPNYGDGYLILSEILIYAGQVEEGIEIARQGIPLDPYLTYHHLLHIANGYIVLGDYDRAIDTAKRAIEHNVDWPGGYIWLSSLYGQLGPSDEAGRMYAEVVRQTPGFSIETRAQIFAYRDRTITDWMVEGLYKASAAANS
jgi:adenylate cyclase